MNLRSIKHVKDLAGKRVLVRVDYNVGIKRGKVEEPYRIAASLETINFLLEKKACVVLITHSGRPGGKVMKDLKVDPIAKELEKLIHKNIRIIRTGDWSQVKKIEKEVSKIKEGTIVMFDNIRFAEGEENNKEYFSKELASLGDIFVLDGFGVAHRSSPSVTGVANYIPSYAGLLLEKEVAGLTHVLEMEKKGSVLLIGGAKIETKLPVITHLKNKVEVILVGGGIVNTYLKSQGFGVGASLIDEGMISEAKKLKAIHSIEWPVDLVVGKKDGSGVRVVSVPKKPCVLCSDDEAIFDIGPATIRLYAEDIRLATSIIWNGAMGYFEQTPYGVGTYSVARLVAAQSKGRAYGVIGGGETIQAMNQTGMTEYVDMISTGGGAMLEFLSGKKLPGVEIVTKHSS